MKIQEDLKDYDNDKCTTIDDHFSDCIKLSKKIYKSLSSYQRLMNDTGKWFERIAHTCEWMGSYCEKKHFKNKDNSGDQTRCFKQCLVGKFKDRHFLSLLCYENFASLFYIPYIHLVFRICEVVTFDIKSQQSSEMEQHDTDEKILDIQGCQTKPTTEAIFQAWCHPENMVGNSVVYRYVWKQISTFFIALLWFIILILLNKFFGILSRIGTLEHFSCALQNICLVCYMLKKFQFIVVILVAGVVQLVIIFMSLYNIFGLRRKIRSNDCSLFELFQFLSMHDIYNTPNNTSSLNTGINRASLSDSLLSL